MLHSAMCISYHVISCYYSWALSVYNKQEYLVCNDYLNDLHTHILKKYVSRYLKIHAAVNTSDAILHYCMKYLEVSSR